MCLGRQIVRWPKLSSGWDVKDRLVWSRAGKMCWAWQVWAYSRRLSLRVIVPKLRLTSIGNGSMDSGGLVAQGMCPGFEKRVGEIDAR